MKIPFTIVLSCLLAAPACLPQGLSHSPAFRGAAAGFPTGSAANPSYIIADGLITFSVAGTNLGAGISTNWIYSCMFTNPANSYSVYPKLVDVNSNSIFVGTNGFQGPLPVKVGSTTYALTATNGMDCMMTTNGGISILFNTAQSNLSSAMLFKPVAQNSFSTIDWHQHVESNGRLATGNHHDTPGTQYYQLENWDSTAGPSIAWMPTNRWYLSCLGTFNSVSNYVSLFDPTNNWNQLGISGKGYDTTAGSDNRFKEIDVGPVNLHSHITTGTTSCVALLYWRAGSYATNASYPLGPGSVLALLDTPAGRQWERQHPEVEPLLAVLRAPDNSGEGNCDYVTSPVIWDVNTADTSLVASMRPDGKPSWRDWMVWPSAGLDIARWTVVSRRRDGSVDGGVGPASGFREKPFLSANYNDQ